MKNIVILSAVLCVAFLASCGDPNYETKGKVFMKKTISLAELWEKREELEGELVTLDLDTIGGVGAGSFPKVDGFENREAQLWYVNDYGLYGLANWTRFYAQHADSLKANPYVFAGSYEINLVNGFDKDIVMPDWAKYKGSFLQKDELLNFLATTEYSSRKIVSGVLIDTYETVHPLPCIGFSEGKKRVIILAVTGIKQAKGTLETMARVYFGEQCPEEGLDVVPSER